MAYNFKPCDREQLFLLPPSLKEWLPEDHLAWFILDTVSMMDLSKLYKNYRADGWGNAAYEPGMMVALLVYSYCMGERSSRKMECLCNVDIAYRILAVNQLPDHTTIARFRRNNLKTLEAIFIEVLKLCNKAGLVKLGVTALDGTKIQGNTSLSSNKKHERIAREVAKMLEEAEQADAEEDRLYGKNKNKNGNSLPPNLRHREERLKRLQQCKEELEKEAQMREDASKEKKAARDEKEKNTGKKAKGKVAKPVTAEEEKQTMKRNITDPDSKPMKNFRGFVQGYNGQAVATEEQIIIASELTNECNDQKQVEPMIEAMTKTLHEANIEEKCETLLMDAGYCSETNLALEGKKKIEFIVATKQDAKQRKELGLGNEMGSLPEPKNLKEKMARKLKTERGGKLYKKRGGMIEPVFGQIKTCLGFTRFSMRGLEACKAEWKFICGIHNVMKLYRKQGLQPA